MNIEQFCQHLKTVVPAVDTERRLEILANELAAFFGVESQEIGLFKLDERASFATFVWPESNMGGGFKIPIKSFGASFVSSTAKKGVGQINNTFASTSHLKMLEHTLSEREQRIPLQKIMSAPCLYGEKLRWIIQVSRKGKTLEEAGPDFTEQQLSDLETVAETIAPWALD